MAEEEQQNNVIIGVAFDGRYIAYSHYENSYNATYCTENGLLNSEELNFNENELNDLYNYLDTKELQNSLEIAKKCTFKSGQADMLNNPFKK